MAFVFSFPCPPRRVRVATCSATPPPFDGPQDWRAFRARLIQTQTPSTSPDGSFAHPLAVVEPGALLLANPELFSQSQTYFNRAAILLFAHEANGSAGLLLNRPHHYLTGTIPLLPGLRKEDIRMGGDVGDGCLFGLVPDETIGTKLVDGLSMIGGEQLLQHKDKAKLYYGYCGWADGQLESEIARGVWMVAAVSFDYLLDDEVYDRVLAKLS